MARGFFRPEGQAALGAWGEVDDAFREHVVQGSNLVFEVPVEGAN